MKRKEIGPHWQYGREHEMECAQSINNPNTNAVCRAPDYLLGEATRQQQAAISLGRAFRPVRKPGQTGNGFVADHEAMNFAWNWHKQWYTLRIAEEGCFSLTLLHDSNLQ